MKSSDLGKHVSLSFLLARTNGVQLVSYMHPIADNSILYGVLSRAQILGGVTPLASGVCIQDLKAGSVGEHKLVIRAALSVTACRWFVGNSTQEHRPEAGIAPRYYDSSVYILPTINSLRSVDCYEVVIYRRCPTRDSQSVICTVRQYPFGPSLSSR